MTPTSGEITRTHPLIQIITRKSIILLCKRVTGHPVYMYSFEYNSAQNNNGYLCFMELALSYSGKPGFNFDNYYIQ